ncbi:kinase-regulated stress-responsive transcription factor skn7 [Microbotryomycetes sp. JL221]|nr:kinase-regulated stress-responsive transcription factor skn7 [Microbotryomycetes sp. JL221]
MSDYHHYNGDNNGGGGYTQQHMHLRGQQAPAPPSHLTHAQQQHQDSIPNTRKRKAAAQPHQQSQQQQQQQQQQLDDDEDDTKPSKDGKGAGGGSDFVKKLYNMLEGGQYQDVVSWGYTGDSFVVKDINAFTKQILPLHFKHSNFSSFVRQLNKYDFHKVKAPDDRPSPYGEHSWEFTHPEFRADMQTSLENIKRKSTTNKKSTNTTNTRRTTDSIDPGPTTGDFTSLQNQLDQLHHQQSQMNGHMNQIQQDYQVVINEMLNFQRNLVAQDQLMQNLIQYLINLEAGQQNVSTPSTTTAAAAIAPTSNHSQEFQPSQQAQKLISSYTEVARASYDQIADLSRRASMSGSGLPPVPMPPPSFGQIDVRGVMLGSSTGRTSDNDVRSSSNQQQETQSPRQLRSQQQQQQQTHSHHDSPIGQFQPQHFQHPELSTTTSTAGSNNGGIGNRGIGSNHSNESNSTSQQQQNESSGTPRTTTTTTTGGGGSLQTRRNPYVPGWAVPPRVLLVEDDAVCRKLSSKFLEVFGCQIDVATDGVSAVNKMNMQKYDLVLMDIVMPNLDGVSATSLIRQFDPMTPIISMTSNSGPNDIMTYFSHGMNDILPKPFTKEGLLGMLEKHLIHLKVMQQMAEIPRALGFTDNQIQDALAVSTLGEEGNVMNPFSSMGISDHDYVEMLQGVALEKNGKRELEVVPTVDPREGKRMRFQEVGES